jgi:hypothetical protein
MREKRYEAGRGERGSEGFLRNGLYSFFWLKRMMNMISGLADD